MHYLSLTLHSLFCNSVDFFITAVRAISDFWNVRGILQWCCPVYNTFDSWSLPFNKYHFTQLTLAIQEINYPITVSNQAFVLLGLNMPALNLGVHQSRNAITNKNIESLICVKVFLYTILGHANFVWSKGELALVIFIIKRKIGYNISWNKFSMSILSCLISMFVFWWKLKQFHYRQVGDPFV